MPRSSERPTFFSTPVWTEDEVTEFLKREQASRESWAKAGHKPSKFPRSIFLIDHIGETPLPSGGNAPGFRVMGAGNHPGKWVVLVLNPGDHDDQWFSEEAMVLSHELGHSLGLGHSPDKEDLMHCVMNRDSVKMTTDE
jgi:Matrixin